MPLRKFWLESVQSHISFMALGKSLHDSELISLSINWGLWSHLFMDRDSGNVVQKHKATQWGA